MGSNEVPRAFGGTYWVDGPTKPHRDVEQGHDENHRRKLKVFNDLLERMGQLGFLAKDLLDVGDVDAQVQKLMSEKKLSNSKLMDIIEFGRMIHAEMSAITDAARLGKAVKGAHLYCTTFPCHMCAKHIVAAGVERVIFLQPYPKSHAIQLNGNSITFSESEAEEKVFFEPFIGISPRRYRAIFEKSKRKDSDGVALEWYEGSPVPLVADRSGAYIENETPAMSVSLQRLTDLVSGSPDVVSPN